MSEKKAQPTKPESIPEKPTILNEEVLKGVWVDGVGFHIGIDYVMLEGVVSKPRTDKVFVVCRMMFPSRILEQLVKILNEALEKQKSLQKQPNVQEQK